MDKWNELKNLVDADLSHAVHYSSDKQFEHNSMRRVKEWMEYLDKKERKEVVDEALAIINKTHHETLKRLAEGPKEETFYFSGVPDFDKKTWDRMLNNLQGLS